MKRAKFLFNHVTNNNWQSPRIASFEPKEHLIFQNVVHELKIAIPTNEYVSRALFNLVDGHNSAFSGYNILHWSVKLMCKKYIEKYLIDPEGLNGYFLD